MYMCDVEVMWLHVSERMYMCDGMYMCDVEVMWLRECTCVMWRLCG